MSTEQIGFYELPSTPKDRQRLLDAIENCRKAKVRIASEQTYISDTVKTFAKEFGIKTADLNKLIADRAKGTYGETVQKADVYQDLYESLFPNSKPKPVEAEHEADNGDVAQSQVVAQRQAETDAELDKLFGAVTA